MAELPFRGDFYSHGNDPCRLRIPGDCPAEIYAYYCGLFVCGCGGSGSYLYADTEVCRNRPGGKGILSGRQRERSSECGKSSFARNILFICGGAFDGIERKIAQRMNTQVVGFDAQKKAKTIDKNNLLQYVAPQDLKSFGLIPEIIGRLPILTYLKPLDKQALRNILTEPNNAITKQYKKLLEMDGYQLSFADDMLDYVVDKALENKLGARGLRGLMETVMMDVMFDLPSSKPTRRRLSYQFCWSSWQTD